MARNRKDPGYIETDPDGGYQTIELWCYQEAEAECDNLRDRLKLAENELSATRGQLREGQAREAASRAEVGRLREWILKSQGWQQTGHIGPYQWSCNDQDFYTIEQAIEFVGVAL